MMFRFKKFLIYVGVVAAVLIGINAAYNKAHGAKDAWNAGAELQLFNSFDKPIDYDVRWFDHNIEKYKGQWIIRCGGELAPFERYILEDFSLGLGRHYVIFRGADIQELMEFTVNADDAVILLTPRGVIKSKEIPDGN